MKHNGRILVAAPTNVELAAVSSTACRTDIDFAATGIGVLQTTYNLTELLWQNRYELVVCAGTAGSFSTNMRVGDTLIVRSERMDDMSANYFCGYDSIFSKKLLDKNSAPFENEILHSPDAAHVAESMRFRTAQSLTVSLLCKSYEQAQQRNNFYSADIENMEGAAFFYVCLRRRVRFVEIRTIANEVGAPRKEWNMPLALRNLGAAVAHFLRNYEF